MENLSERLYEASWVTNIVGGSDIVYLLAENDLEAIEKAKSLLNTHKLVPNWLNNYGRLYIRVIK